MQCLSYLSYVDMYGSTFNFTTFQKDKFRTGFGGLMSITSFLIILCISFIIGGDFYYRSNPKILSQTVSPNATIPINLKGNKFIIPWHFVDVNDKVLNYTGIVYPVTTYYKYRRDPNTKEMTSITKEIMKNVPCSLDNANVPEFVNNFNYKEWNCFEWTIEDDYEIGGSWDADIVYYFRMQIQYCQESYYQTDGTCTKLEDLQSHLLSSDAFYISILYPQMTYDPNNLENPLRTKFINYYYPLSLLLQKFDRFYFKNIIAKDDLGIVFPDKSEHNMLGYDHQQVDYNLFDLSFYTVPDTSTCFYSLAIYLQVDYDQYSRSFMKLQDLVAILGGILGVVRLIAGGISHIINHYLKSEYLLKESFYFDEDKMRMQMPVLKYISNKTKPLRMIPFHKRTVENNKQNLDLISNSGNYNESNNVMKNINVYKLINNRPNIKSDEIVGHNSVLSRRVRHMNKKPKVGNLQLIVSTKPIHTRYFPFCVALTHSYLCRCCLSPKSNQRAEVYYKALSHLTQKLDITYYLKMLRTVNGLKLLFLNTHQSEAMEHLQKPNISTLGANSNDSADVSEIVKYFVEKKSSNGMQRVDETLMNLLDPKIVDFIKSNL